MPRKEGQKLKLLTLLEIFVRETDEKHPISVPRMVELLKERGIVAERKSVYDDIQTLNEMPDTPFEIVQQRGRGGGYYMVDTPFELAELKLLVDAVYASKFITARKSKVLIEKLGRFTSRYRQEELDRKVLVSGRVKSQEEKILYSVDTLHSAITAGNQVRFKYCDWDLQKQMVPRHEGQLYTVSPWVMVWENGNYYMIAYTEGRLKHYRVDKMRKVELLPDTEREGAEEYAEFDVNQYMQQMFDMFNGPVRHLLAGQVPYRDFTVYLGAGELYSVGGLLLVLGNSFGRSMLATNFCTWFYFELLVLAVCLVVIGTARAARAAALALCSVFFAYVQGANLPFAGQVNTLLSYAAANGNSARMMRSAALTLAVLVILLGLHFWQQDTSRRLLAPAVLVPFAAGFFVPWSNDMGGAAYISIALGYGLYLIRLYRSSIGKIVVQTLRYIVTSVVGLGVSVLLISWGHPLAWLRQTRGTSAYQTWYYGNTLSDRVCSVADLHWPGAAVFCLAAALAFAIGIFACRSKRSAVLAAGGFALTLGMVLWNLLYGMVSASNNGPTGGAAALAAVLAPACIIKAVLLVCQKAKLPQVTARIVPAGCAVLGAAMLAVGMAGQVQTRIGGHEGYTFVPELGGWIGDQAEKLATEKELTAGKQLFGTYSSALEAMTGQLQPTGTDYIIHALGDRQRLAYLQTFQQGNFDMVVTPSPKVAPPERWSRNANWWFYRELYRYWQPVANTFQSGGMHLFWERTGTDNNLNVETATTIAPQGDGTVLVTVTAADADFCGVADVTLHYGLVSSDSMDHPFDRQFLHVTCVTENELCAAAERDTNQGDFYLPTDRDSYEVPITISNGVGQILLTAKSGSGTVYPQVNAVEVNATYQDWEYFFE